MNGSLQPTWLRIAVIVAVVVGIVAAAWLFGTLSAPAALPLQ
jgi:hypothetical protein